MSVGGGGLHDLAFQLCRALIPRSDFAHYRARFPNGRNSRLRLGRMSNRTRALRLAAAVIGMTGRSEVRQAGLLRWHVAGLVLRSNHAKCDAFPNAIGNCLTVPSPPGLNQVATQFPAPKPTNRRSPRFTPGLTTPLTASFLTNSPQSCS